MCSSNSTGQSSLRTSSYLNSTRHLGEARDCVAIAAAAGGCKPLPRTAYCCRHRPHCSNCTLDRAGPSWIRRLAIRHHRNTVIRITDLQTKGRGIGKGRLLRPAQHTQVLGCDGSLTHSALQFIFHRRQVLVAALLAACACLPACCLCTRRSLPACPAPLAKSFFRKSGKRALVPRPTPHQSAPSALSFLFALHPAPRVSVGRSYARQHHASRHLGCTRRQAAAAGPAAPGVRHGSSRHANEGAWWCAILCRLPFGVCGTDYLKVRLHL